MPPAAFLPCAVAENLAYGTNFGCPDAVALWMQVGWRGANTICLQIVICHASLLLRCLKCTGQLHSVRFQSGAACTT